MILSAMMFALGAFVSGLAWLAFAVALVRRERRLTERRLLASISVRRSEFEAERDELRARHAVQIYRSEREVSRVLDMATAYRLEADINEREVVSLKAELAAREEDMQDLQLKMEGERDLIQELERKNAETGAALRAAQHALKLEMTRRSMAEEALDDAGLATDQRRVALSSLREENDALRSALGERPPFENEAPTRETRTPEQRSAFAGGSVVPLPTRRPGPPDSPEHSAALVADAARDLQRLAGEGHGDLGNAVWRAPAHGEPRLPSANGPGEAGVAELTARRMAPKIAPVSIEDRAAPEGENPETRFFEALAEIRALKRAASQAGE